MSDAIFLEGMVFYGYHGVHEEERALGQRFEVDLEVETDTSKAGKSDDLNHTVNYSALYRVTKEAVEGTPRNLLEALAEDLAARILAGFPVVAVRIRIRKPGVAIKGSILSAAGVEIWRRRESAGARRVHRGG
ncbi:MAG: dihydroneopterin aldolase [Chloroflexi bacterium]|nr:dihydroneopterin aldolase [Chloroflexota bacterium]